MPRVQEDLAARHLPRLNDLGFALVASGADAVSAHRIGPFGEQELKVAVGPDGRVRVLLSILREDPLIPSSVWQPWSLAGMGVPVEGVKCRTDAEVDDLFDRILDLLEGSLLPMLDAAPTNSG
jgi:hypothetical protein